MGLAVSVKDMPAVSQPQSNPIVLFSLLNSFSPEIFFLTLIKAGKVTLMPLRSITVGT